MKDIGKTEEDSGLMMRKLQKVKVMVIKA